MGGPRNRIFSSLSMYTNFLLNVSSCGVAQSTAPVELTEAETEYSVNVVKHVFPAHLVLQFNVINTIAEQLLEDVSAPLSNPLLVSQCNSSEFLLV